MKKRRLLPMILAAALSLSLASCGSIPTSDTVDPDTFVTEQITSTDTSYEWNEIPWYTTKKEVAKKMKEHTLYLDEGDMLHYTQNKTLTDGTPVKTKLSFGFTDATDDGELAGIRWVFLLEDSEKANQLFQSLRQQMEPWMETDNYHGMPDETMTVMNKESGSYLDLRVMSSDTTTEPMWWSEYPEELWDPFSEVALFIWFPEDRLELMQNHANSN
ncbi:MAG: hypothetical protein ACLU6W_06035 [Lachnospiraceae bacterium]